jgi:hypothetical protein
MQNPTGLLSPDGGEGDRTRGLFEVQGFNVRNWLRGILTPALSPFGRGEGERHRVAGDGLRLGFVLRNGAHGVTRPTNPGLVTRFDLTVTFRLG